MPFVPFMLCDRLTDVHQLNVIAHLPGTSLRTRGRLVGDIRPEAAGR